MFIYNLFGLPVESAFGDSIGSYTLLNRYKFNPWIMRVAQEEIFGPVAVVIKFKDEEDVIRMANDSTYGLGGAVWTRDINRAIRVSRAVETGRMKNIKPRDNIEVL